MTATIEVLRSNNILFTPTTVLVCTEWSKLILYNIILYKKKKILNGGEGVGVLLLSFKL